MATDLKPSSSSETGIPDLENTNYAVNKQKNKTQDRSYKESDSSSTEINQLADSFLGATSKVWFTDGEQLKQVAEKVKEKNAADVFEAEVRRKSGRDVQEIINKEISEGMTKTDQQKFNDAYYGKDEFGNSDPFTYFADGVKHWFQALARAGAQMISDPVKVIWGFVSSDPVRAAQIFAGIGGLIILCFICPPLGAIITAGTLAWAGFNISKNSIDAFTAKSKEEKADAILRVAYSVMDALLELPGIPGTIKELKEFRRAAKIVDTTADTVNITDDIVHVTDQVAIPHSDITPPIPEEVIPTPHNESLKPTNTLTPKELSRLTEDQAKLVQILLDSGMSKKQAISAATGQTFQPFVFAKNPTVVELDEVVEMLVDEWKAGNLHLDDALNAWPEAFKKAILDGKIKITEEELRHLIDKAKIDISEKDLNHLFPPPPRNNPSQTNTTITKPKRVIQGQPANNNGASFFDDWENAKIQLDNRLNADFHGRFGKFKDYGNGPWELLREKPPLIKLSSWEDIDSRLEWALKNKRGGLLEEAKVIKSVKNKGFKITGYGDLYIEFDSKGIGKSIGEVDGWVQTPTNKNNVLLEVTLRDDEKVNQINRYLKKEKGINPNSNPVVLHAENYTMENFQKILDEFNPHQSCLRPNERNEYMRLFLTQNDKQLFYVLEKIDENMPYEDIQKGLNLLR